MATDAETLALLFGGGSTPTKGIASDIAQFENILGKNDYWKMAAAPVAAAKFDTSTWSPGQTFGVSAGQAFLSSALNMLGQRSEGEQLAKVAKILPQLYKDPSSVAIPEGVDTEAGGALKLAALKDFALRQEASSNSKEKLFADVFSKNPSIALQTMPEMATKFGITVPEEKPREVSQVDSTIPNLSVGGASTAKKVLSYTNEFINGGMPPAQAAIAARQQVADEIKNNAKSFDDAKAAREYGQKLLDMANTAKAGISEAGTTGPYNTLAHAYENIANLFGSQEAAKQLRGDATLSSIAPELIKMSRSPGAVSDFESKLYLGAGPNTNQTPETNALLANKMEELGKLNLDYADFLEAFKQANAGNTSGAASKWAEYRTKFPLFVGDENNMQLNTNRPSWQEYFSGAVQAPAQDSADITSPKLDIASFIAEAKAAGLSKEEAKARWEKLNSLM